MRTRPVLFVWAKENSFFVMVLQFLSNFVCVLIMLELEHMQKGRLRNIEEHFQNRVSIVDFCCVLVPPLTNVLN